jgi:valyl-tRNA synthetase
VCSSDLLYYLPNKSSLENIEIIQKIATINRLEESTKNNFAMVNSFLIKNFEFFIPLEEGYDKDAEIEKLKKELDYNERFLKSVQNKLMNKDFVNNAPDTIVNKEKQKIIDTDLKIKSLKKSITDLS